MDELGSIGIRILRQLSDPAVAASLPALFAALVIVSFFTYRGLRRGHDIRPATLARAWFPKRIYRSASGKTDFAFAAFAITFFSLVFGWAIIGAATVGRGVEGVLVDAFGPTEPTDLPTWSIVLLATVSGYLVIELAHWLNHYLSHRIEFLWQFHAVHHSAESLSPITNYRSHPVDTILYSNTIAVAVGALAGLLSFLFPGGWNALLFNGTNVLLLLGLLIFTSLQHSHFWISFPGFWGKVFLSPAHHQIHHSKDPAHFNTNLGSSLAIWDWLFGTLHVPEKRRQALNFGVDGIERPHSFRSAIIAPFVRAARSFRRKESQAGAVVLK